MIVSGEKLHNLILTMKNLGTRRIDGDGFSIYWVGNNLIRIDIKVEETEDETGKGDS